MKMIGLIGGMSWKSSAKYYRIINEGVRDRVGPTASARCLLWSFNFSEIEDLQHRGDWQGLTARMVDAAQRLVAGGADMLLICTNTMHRMAADVQAAVDVPLLHIADPTAERIKAAGFSKVGLLGTAFTMELPSTRAGSPISTASASSYRMTRIALPSTASFMRSWSPVKSCRLHATHTARSSLA